MKLKLLQKQKSNPILYKNTRYYVKLADTDEEKKQTYKLRYDVFHDELGELPENPDRIDRDEYDDDCDHLIIVHKQTHRVIGTYRILPWFKRNPKRGYIAEQEFRLTGMPSANIAELGRLCIDKAFRKTNSFITLWLGLYRYTKKYRVKYLFGVASTKKDEPEENVRKMYNYLRKTKRITRQFRVQAVTPLPLGDMTTISKKEFNMIAPRMIKNYVRIGTKFIGVPSYDPVFRVYDLLTIWDNHTLKMKSINSVLTLRNHLKTRMSQT